LRGRHVGRQRREQLLGLLQELAVVRRSKGRCAGKHRREDGRGGGQFRGHGPSTARSTRQWQMILKPWRELDENPMRRS
jgi:hypothetical protein